MRISISKKFWPWLLLVTLLLTKPLLAQEQGGQLIVERIDIFGAHKTKPQVIHRYLSFGEGDMLTPEIIEHAYQALAATNFFKRVDFSTAPGSEKGRVIVVIEVQERRWPTLEFAGGYSELDGWYFSPIGVRYDNLFGSGHFLNLRIIFGDRVGGLNFRFQQPHIFNSDLHFQLDMDVLGRNFIHYFDGREAVQRVDNATLRLGLAGSQGLGKFISGGYQISTVTPDSFAVLSANGQRVEDFPPSIADDLGKTDIGAFWLRLQADTRDNAFFTRRGIWGALSVEAADPQFGGTIRFTRSILDGRFYQGIKNSVIALRVKAGVISDTAPFYERFYLGGAYSLRGYAERSLTPTGYGTRLWLSSAEWRVPVSGRHPRRPTLIGVVFFDIGSIGNEEKKFGDEIFASVGFGFRLNVPILGVARFDFAYPQQYPEDFRFHLALGHSF
jgi:outer membrane protein insertion porin family